MELGKKQYIHIKIWQDTELFFFVTSSKQNKSLNNNVEVPEFNHFVQILKKKGHWDNFNMDETVD